MYLFYTQSSQFRYTLSISFFVWVECPTHAPPTSPRLSPTSPRLPPTSPRRPPMSPRLPPPHHHLKVSSHRIDEDCRNHAEVKVHSSPSEAAKRCERRKGKVYICDSVQLTAACTRTGQPLKSSNIFNAKLTGK